MNTINTECIDGYFFVLNGFDGYCNMDVTQFTVIRKPI